jgi:hypothetical protein
MPRLDSVAPLQVDWKFDPCAPEMAPFLNRWH